MSYTYSLPGMPTLSGIITQILENIIYGWYPVYNEEIVYSDGTYYYDLEGDGSDEKNLIDIIEVKGVVDGTEYIFTESVDFTFEDTTGDNKYNKFRWLTSGTQPDDGTTFYVSYRYQGDSTGLTDISEGSVLRTIVEAFAIQIYRTFQKLEEVGRDSFVDTAVGRRLDLLGRIVGVTRNEATRATGYVTLRRDPSSVNSNIDIPVGTILSTVATSTSPAIQFQTTKSARIRSGETTAVTYTDSSDSDYLQPWVAVEAVNAGEDGNVSAGTIVRNVTAPGQITYVYNNATYDMSGEELDGDGNTQKFTLAHPVATTSSLGIKYIEYKYGFIKQPSTASVLKFTLSGGYATGSVTVTVYGTVSGSFDSESSTLDNSTRTWTTTKMFSEIRYITFANSDDQSEGIGEGIGAGATIKVEAITPDPDEVLLGSQGTGAAVGTQVDSGRLDMIADADYIWLYLWEDDSWRLKTIGTTGAGTNHYYYVDEDTGSFSAGMIYWDSGSGSTWTETEPYYTQYNAGPNGDGKNIKIEYYPIAGETGTSATAQESGITAIAIKNEYKYGWLKQPASESTIYVETSGAWSGTCVIHGTTTTGGEDDECVLTFSSDTQKDTGSTKFSRIDYVTFANSDNPSEGIGEGTASSITVKIGVTSGGTEIMGSSACGTRVDGGWLSVVGIDSDDTLKVYVWNNGWSLHTQAQPSNNFSYTDEGDNAGLIDWGSTWDWSTSPYVNHYDAGPFGDGRNIRIDYVPKFGQYSTDGAYLSLEGAPPVDSTIVVSYTWSNDFSDGSDTEDDDSYRNRIMSALSSSAKGTLEAIRSAVLDVDGVVGVEVDDHSTDPSIPIGEVHVYAWTSTGLLDAGTRSKVSDAVNETRAAGVKPIVRSPTPIYIAVEVTVKADSSSSRSLDDIEDDAESAIADYINRLGINTPMYKSDLIDVIEGVSGVKYVDISSLKVYGYDTATATAVSQEQPYSSSPYWSFAESSDATHQLWSNNGNIIYVNSGYVLRADTDSSGSNNKAITVTAEYE